MPRSLENLLAIGFALTLFPMLMFMSVRISLGDHLAWLAVAGVLYLAVLGFDILSKNRLGAAGAMGRWVVLAFALGMSGYAIYDMYRMYGENQRVSPLSNTLVTIGWLMAVSGPYLIFQQLGSRPAVAFLTPDPVEPAKT